MSLRFIHTADWQIGKPFGAFDERKQTLLREARITAIDRIAEAAAARGAAQVLVAGDVFDSSSVADQTLRQTMARLAKHAGLTWHLLPGNHDPLKAGGVWDRLTRSGMPGNVVVHTRAEPFPLTSDAVLLSSPLTAAASSRDPTSWMDTAATTPGVVRIGLAHGSVRGFGSDGEAAQQIDPARARSAGLAYLALGDWHGAVSVSERVWYAGTPEPDRFPDNEPGHVLAVTIGDGATGATSPVTVERVPTAYYRWVEREVRIEQTADWERLAAEIAVGAMLAGTPPDRQIVRVILRGAVTMAERGAIDAGLEALEPGLFHLDADLTDLHEHSADRDLESLSDEGTRALASRLQSMCETGDDSQRATARLALRKLIRLDAQIAGRGAQPPWTNAPGGSP